MGYRPGVIDSTNLAAKQAGRQRSCWCFVRVRNGSTRARSRRRGSRPQQASELPAQSPIWLTQCAACDRDEPCAGHQNATPADDRHRALLGLCPAHSLRYLF